MPPQKKGAQLRLSQFLAHVCCGQTAGWIKMPLGMEVGFGPGHIMLDGDSHPTPKKGQPPTFCPCLLWPNGWMDQDATWYEGRPRPRPHCVVWGSSFPPPQFSVHVYCHVWPNARPSQLLLSTCYTVAEMHIFCQKSKSTSRSRVLKLVSRLTMT